MHEKNCWTRFKTRKVGTIKFPSNKRGGRPRSGCSGCVWFWTSSTVALLRYGTLEALLPVSVGQFIVCLQ